MLELSTLATTLIMLGVAMLLGLMMTKLLGRFGLPNVTSYLIIGLILGPFVLGRFGLGFTSIEQLESLTIISDVALGFIAFSIGNEFRLSALKQTGKQATVIAIAQALVTTFMVDAVLLIAYFAFNLGDKIGIETCITLGAIATATAPAATLMVVHQYNAKGPLTSLLLPIVALDDAVGLIVFAVSFGIAKAINSGGAINVVTIMVNPLIEVIGSLILGSVVGVVFCWVEKILRSEKKRLDMSIGFVFLAVGLSKIKVEFSGSDIEIGFSTLLVCMMLGTLFCNLCEFSQTIIEEDVDRWVAPLFLLFFILSGAELDITVFTSGVVVLIGVLYIISRSFGKYIGTFISAKSVKCSPMVCKYLGITLLPQAGVALGMSLTASQVLGQAGTLIRNIVLFAVLIYELVGPLLTKMALKAAGEIDKNA